MARHYGAYDGKPHAGAAGVAAGGEEGVEDAVAICRRDRVAVVADDDPDRCIVVGGFGPDVLGVVPDRIVGEVSQHDQRLLRRHADGAIEAAAGVDRAGREAALQPADDGAELAALVLWWAFGAGELAQPLRHGF